MKLPVRVRLTLWYTTVLLVILTAVGFFVVARLHRSLIASLDETIGARSQVVANGIDSRAETLDRLVLPSLGVPDVIAQVIAPDGRLIETAGEAVPRRPLVGGVSLRRAMQTPLYGTAQSSSEHTSYRIIAIPIRSHADVLVVGRELDDVRRTVRGVVVLLLLASPVALALAAAGGWLLARAALRPVDVMTRTAAAIDARGRHEPIPVSAPDDELARLARTMNDMLDRLHSALEEERRFSADASHELRTPLGIMAAELDVSLRSKTTPDVIRPALESMREEVASLTRIVENLFLLARLDEPDAFLVQRTSVDLLDASRQVAERFGDKAAQRGVELHVEGAAAVVQTDADSFHRVIANLMDNAIDHTEPGGDVRLSIADGPREATLTVTDTGVGVPREHLAHIFDRFYRADPARSRNTGGAGLGLAIVRRLVEMQGGSVEARSEPGRGTSFVVHLVHD